MTLSQRIRRIHNQVATMSTTVPNAKRNTNPLLGGGMPLTFDDAGTIRRVAGPQNGLSQAVIENTRVCRFLDPRFNFLLPSVYPTGKKD
jgi:hypothetical protein